MQVYFLKVCWIANTYNEFSILVESVLILKSFVLHYWYALLMSALISLQAVILYFRKSTDTTL